MAERDPFGRLPDENPLAGLGALSDGTASQAAEPVVPAPESWASAAPSARATPAEPSRPATPPPSRPAMSASSASQPRTGSPALDQSLAEAIRQAEAMSGVKVAQSVRTVGRVVKLVVLLVVIGVFAGVGSTIFSAGKDVRDAISDFDATPKAFDETETPRSEAPAQVTPERPATLPTGLSSRSMLVRANFRAAMARLGKAGLGRMRTLSIRPERVDAQLLTKGGALRSVQVKFDEHALDDFGASGSGFSHLDTIPFAKINTAAPGRLARSAAGRSRKPVSQIDYVVLSSFAGRIQWNAYMKGGRIYQADSRGHIQRRIS